MNLNVCGICTGASSGRFWICCDSCSQWFHIRCLHMTRKHSEELQKYMCANCITTESSQQGRGNDCLDFLQKNVLCIKDVMNKLRKDVEALNDKISMMEACAAKKACVDKGVQCDYLKKEDKGSQCDNLEKEDKSSQCDPEKEEKGSQCDNPEKEDKGTHCNLEEEEKVVLYNARKRLESINNKPLKKMCRSQDVQGIISTEKPTEENISSSLPCTKSLHKGHSSSKPSKLSLKKASRPVAVSDFSAAMARHDEMDADDFKPKRR